MENNDTRRIMNDFDENAYPFNESNWIMTSSTVISVLFLAFALQRLINFVESYKKLRVFQGQFKLPC